MKAAIRKPRKWPCQLHFLLKCFNTQMLVAVVVHQRASLFLETIGWYGDGITGASVITQLKVCTVYCNYRAVRGNTNHGRLGEGVENRANTSGKGCEKRGWGGVTEHPRTKVPKLRQARYRISQALISGTGMRLNVMQGCAGHSVGGKGKRETAPWPT